MPTAGRYQRAEQTYTSMPFGKHKTLEFSEIETRYLQWVLKDDYDMLQDYPGLEKSIREFLSLGQSSWSFNEDEDYYRSGRGRYDRQQERKTYTPPRRGRSPDRELMAAIIAAGRRSLAMKYHPDICKTEDATQKMQAVNAAADYLEEIIKSL